MNFVVWVELECAPELHAELLEHVRRNAAASLERESGCRQFDVLVSTHHRDLVALYEVYDSEDAFDAHVQTAHYREFARQTASLVAAKRVTSFHRR
jgi:quinol monooxygenase YgiN